MGRRHRVSLVAGSLLAAAALLPPVIGAAARMLSTHMLLEMLLLAVVMPLLAYGSAPLLARGRTRWAHPIAGMVGLNVALFGWQVPAILDLSVRNLAVGEAAQVVFMAAALSFWWPIVAAGEGGPSRIAKIGCLMVAGVPPTFPGILLAFSRHLFYPGYRSLDDQQLAGLMLFATAKFALVTGAFIILWRMLTPEAEPPEDDDGHGRVTGPSPAPAWLRELDRDLPAEPAPVRRPVLAGR